VGTVASSSCFSVAWLQPYTASGQEQWKVDSISLFGTASVAVVAVVGRISYEDVVATTVAAGVVVVVLAPGQSSLLLTGCCCSQFRRVWRCWCSPGAVALLAAGFQHPNKRPIYMYGTNLASQRHHHHIPNRVIRSTPRKNGTNVFATTYALKTMPPTNPLAYPHGGHRPVREAVVSSRL